MSNTEILDILTKNCNTISTQEAGQATKCNKNTGNSNSKSTNVDKWMVNNNKINYFLPGPSEENDKKQIAEIIQQLQRDFKDVFNGIGCFDGTFLLQVEPDSKPFQTPLEHIAYALQSLSMRS